MPGSDSDSLLALGSVFAGHRILSVAGRGGMGVVYRAQQVDLDRPVALKLIATPFASDPAFRARFERETRAAAAIDHPNVIPVYSAGEHDGHLYLAMRYVDGEDLRARVRAQGPIAPRAAARLTAQIGAALDAAHARGLVHRDVKPANVLLDGTHAYLTDFGLSKRTDAESTMTGDRHWVGTLGYVAPEQIRGEAVDARADVYALGCVLHYMLTGESPFPRDNHEATLYAHLHQEPPRADELIPGTPSELTDVIARALAKDPDDRFPSAGDLGAAALAAVGEGAPRPERAVARGAAAPGGADEEETIAGAHESPDVVTPTAATRLADTAATTPAGGGGRRRGLLAVAVVAVVGAGVALAIALTGRDDRPTTPASPPTTTATTAPVATAPRIVKGAALRVDSRPNAIAYGFRRVWVTSGRSGRLIGLAAEPGSGLRRRSVRIGGDITSVTAAFDALWVTTGRGHQLVKVDRRTLKIEKRITLPPGQAVTAAADDSYLWVGLRPPPGISTVMRVDPSTGAQTRLPPFGEEGIGYIASGDGSIWVANRRRPRLSAIDPGTLDRRSSPQIGAAPRGVAYGHRRVWVTSETASIVAVAPPSLSNVLQQETCRSPIGIAVGDPGAWVACKLADRVQLIRTGRDGRPRSGSHATLSVRVGSNPFAIAAHGNRAWVTNLADATITPLRYDAGD